MSKSFDAGDVVFVLKSDGDLAKCKVFAHDGDMVAVKSYWNDDSRGIHHENKVFGSFREVCKEAGHVA